MKISKKISFYLQSRLASNSLYRSFNSPGKPGYLPAACLLALLFTLVLHPGTAKGCACGCGIFDVGSVDLFPSQPGGMLSLEYDFQDQNHDWSGTSRAPSENNPDKQIRTNFVTSSLLYMFNQSWGMSLDMPFANRFFKTTGGASGNEIVGVDWNALGDLRVKGIYTGFSPDMSTGLDFGLRIPTGDWKSNDAYGDVDRDSEIGTGSLDFLVGAFHHQKLTPDNQWGWFVQVDSDLPAFTQGGYRPGFEIDGATGIQYNGWSSGQQKCIPSLELKASGRTIDSGPAAANPVASGYERLLVAPGVEFAIHPVMVYADVEIPVFQHVNGNQLVAPALFKLTVAYMF